MRKWFFQYQKKVAISSQKFAHFRISENRFSDIRNYFLIWRNIYWYSYSALHTLLLVWITFYWAQLLGLLISMVKILETREIWIYMFQSTLKKYANIVSYIKEVCYGMTCPMRWQDSRHTMAFVFIVLHVLCFKPIHIAPLKFLCISLIYVCISVQRNQFMSFNNQLPVVEQYNYQILLLYKMWWYYNKFDSTNSLAVCYWCVKVPQCGYMEHGLKLIMFYGQNI